MEPETETLARRAPVLAAAALVVVALTVLLGSARPAAAQGGCTPVLGQATTTPAQLAGWFDSAKRQPKLDLSVLELATVFVEEGAREGVRGDIAFAQAVVETGYFGFSASVPPELHNYSGLGATGGGVKGAAFPDARTGVRAQVQHLRAYADPSLRSAADLKAPLVDPRFRFLVPNSKTVPCWEQFGSGVWAADPTGYGPRVLSLHLRIAAFPVPAAPAPAPAVAVPAAVEPGPPALSAPAIPNPQALVAAEVLLPDAIAAEALISAWPETPTTELVARTAGTSATAGGGMAGTIACLFTGLGLLTICVTLWWHGRRFARPLS